MPDRLGHLLSWHLGWTQKNELNIEEGMAYLSAAVDIFEKLENTWWLAWAKGWFGISMNSARML
jgi:hypothetical protein